MRNFILFLALAAISPAATITNITVTNLSSPNSATSSSGIDQEFSSGNISTSAVTTVGPVSSFTNQFGWFAGLRTDGTTTTDTTFSPTLSYEISFTVLDPTNAGYFFFVNSEGRGWLTLELDATTPSGSLLTASGTGLDADVSDGTTTLIAPNLAIAPDFQMADDLTTSLNSLVTSSGSALSGARVGDNTFTIRMTSNDLSLFSATGSIGETGQRFGLTPTLPAFSFLSTPGTDGEDAALLGHFLTINMVSATASVPEPSTGQFLTFALLLLLPLRRTILKTR